MTTTTAPDLAAELAETLTVLRIARIHRDHLRRHRMPPAVTHLLDAKVIVAQRHLDRLLETVQH